MFTTPLPVFRVAILLPGPCSSGNHLLLSSAACNEGSADPMAEGIMANIWLYDSCNRCNKHNRRSMYSKHSRLVTLELSQHGRRTAPQLGSMLGATARQQHSSVLMRTMHKRLPLCVAQQRPDLRQGHQCHAFVQTAGVQFSPSFSSALNVAVPWSAYQRLFRALWPVGRFWWPPDRGEPVSYVLGVMTACRKPCATCTQDSCIMLHFCDWAFTAINILRLLPCLQGLLQQ